MTIKKRLFLSNILMIIIPVILSIFMCMVMFFFFRHAIGLEKGEQYKYKDNYLFYAAVEELQQSTAGLEDNIDIKKIDQEIRPIFSRGHGDALSLLVYQGAEQVYSIGNMVDESMLENALMLSGEHYYVVDRQAVYSKDVGEYKFIIGDIDHFSDGILDYRDYGEFEQYAINVMTLSFVTVIIIILVTNLLLTKMVFKSIIVPLDILVFGVHQLGDGNLDYRIIYHGTDEFSSVCKAFNEMAGHLQNMVMARQKDEENRKELIAGISHDLRTPLTSIKGYVIGLEEGIDTTPQIRKRYLDILKSKTSDIEHLVNQLFLFSKIDIGDFPLSIESIDIGAELERYINEIKDEYRRKGLEVRIGSNIFETTVRADVVQLRSVYLNILENAVKYGNKENKIMTVSCTRKGDRVIIKMQDNGAGVPEKSLDNLFNVFYRADKSRKDPGKGSGLGLAIASKMINRLNGTIHAENAENGGLAIVIILPVESGGKQDETDIDHRR